MDTKERICFVDVKLSKEGWDIRVEDLTLVEELENKYIFVPFKWWVTTDDFVTRIYKMYFHHLYKNNHIGDDTFQYTTLCYASEVDEYTQKLKDKVLADFAILKQTVDTIQSHI